MDPDFAVRAGVLDRLQALALGDGEERPLHHVGVIFGRVVNQLRNEEIPDGMRVWS